MTMTTVFGDKAKERNLVQHTRIKRNFHLQTIFRQQCMNLLNDDVDFATYIRHMSLANHAYISGTSRHACNVTSVTSQPLTFIGFN